MSSIFSEKITKFSSKIREICRVDKFIPMVHFLINFVFHSNYIGASIARPAEEYYELAGISRQNRSIFLPDDNARPYRLNQPVHSELPYTIIFFFPFRTL